jgi:hypothetical protein
MFICIYKGFWRERNINEEGVMVSMARFFSFRWAVMRMRKKIALAEIQLEKARKAHQEKPDEFSLRDLNLAKENLRTDKNLLEDIQRARKSLIGRAIRISGKKGLRQRIIKRKRKA